MLLSSFFFPSALSARGPISYTLTEYLLRQLKFWHSTEMWYLCSIIMSRGQLKCDGTRAETRFRLSAKRTSPFKSAGASVQSTTGSRGVRISDSNAGYTMFRGSVKGTSYPLHSPVSPLTSPPVRLCVPSHFNWSLLRCTSSMFTCYHLKLVSGTLKRYVTNFKDYLIGAQILRELCVEMYVTYLLHGVESFLSS
jgi:hypothetical protein